MNERLLKLAQRISGALRELQRVINRAQEGWRRAQQSSDDFYLDSVALNLHSFYSGLERLFELIATAIDETLPHGANWHQVLLQQMTAEITDVRPAVISEGTYEALDVYRGFRHIVRNVYALQFDVVKVQWLVEEAPIAFAQVRSELLAFAAFLEQQARMAEE